MTHRCHSTIPTTAARMAWASVLAVACSLNVPSASELYDGEPPVGQSSGAGPGGSAAPNGGAGPDGGAGPNGGATPGGGDVVTDDVELATGGNVASLSGASEARSGTDAGNAVTRANDDSRERAVLLVHYSFDDVNGSSIPDSSGGGRFAISAGNPTPLTEPGRVGRALHLLGGSSSQFVQLPVDILKSLRAVSVSSWFNLTLNGTWDRLFDFNAGVDTWFFFSPTGWNAQTLTNGTHVGVRLNADDVGATFFSLTEPVAAGAWHHVAIVWAPPLVSYYLDGVLMHAAPVALVPDDLGHTYQNWLGRSAYDTDPYFSGLIDEFRIYSGALSETEIAELVAEGN